MSDLKFKPVYDPYRRGAIGIDDVIDYAVIDAGRGSESGQLERMSAELNELRKIVGIMAKMMPPEVHRELANVLGYQEVKT